MKKTRWIKIISLAILTLVLLCMVIAVWNSVTYEPEFSNFFNPIFEGGN